MNNDTFLHKRFVILVIILLNNKCNFDFVDLQIPLEYLKKHP